MEQREFFKKVGICENAPLRHTRNFRKLAPKTDEKVLAGLSHYPHAIDDELRFVMLVAEAVAPAKVGVEVPADYKVMRREGRNILLFSEIIKRMESAKAEIVPLDDHDTWNRRNILAFALYLTENPKARVMLSIRIQESEEQMLWCSPERTIALNRQMGFDAEALRCAEEHTPQELRELIDECDRNREAIMLCGIQEAAPELVILGHGHGVKIAQQISDYTYVESEYIEPDFSPEMGYGLL